MKAILSLVATVVLLGLLPLAFAEPKTGGASALEVSVETESRPLPKPPIPPQDKPAIKLPLTPAQEAKLLDLLNEGTAEELSAIPGIADTRADSISKARPFGSLHEVILVDGVGRSTFEKILAHGKSLSSPKAATRKS